ncbi:aspartyl/asparaginyl beta-hydroxylase domain-containing protein [Sphingomonas sp. RT2P30]|uniref:aspartyl/asparaginyl beta-hydroxylase domain-containing protein n=1 Tax=Parasphingomonas halimpatiens TaxID=3096162 RepID=UPI002FC99F06
MKGDLMAEHDPRAASAFYQAALGNAAQAQEKGPLNAPLIAELRRIETFLGRAAADYEAHLLDHLAAAGFAPRALAPRVQHAIDLLTGKREIYLQQPSAFYFPGLPQIEFYERDAFAWLPALEAAAPAMRAELEALIAEDGDFAPYVETPTGRPPPRNPLLDDPSWGACYLWKAGARVARNADRCPRTMAALAAAPIPHIRARSPMALFSLLKPGTHITPHHGLLNTRLIVHLPLIAPPDCGLRVGSQTRTWRMGEALIFDDSIEHEAWNRGTETRVVLLFEIWRPEIVEEERAALTALFEAIGAFGDEA